MEHQSTSFNPAAGLGRLLAAQEAERRRFAAEAHARARRRILDAAEIDPDTLSGQGQRTLDWLADWDKPTIDGSPRLDAAMARLDAQDSRRHGPDVDAPGVEL